MAMRLCAVVKNGLVKLVTLVPETHDLGPREGGYSHMLVKLVQQMPDEYNGPCIEEPKKKRGKKE